MEVACYLCFRHALLQRWNRLDRLQQELVVSGAAILQVLGPAYDPDAGDSIAQRNEPCPAVVESVDADVAGITALPPRHSLEVCEDRRALVVPAAVLYAQLLANQRIPARRVHQVATIQSKGGPGVRSAFDRDRVAAG